VLSCLSYTKHTTTLNKVVYIVSLGHCVMGRRKRFFFLRVFHVLRRARNQEDFSIMTMMKVKNIQVQAWVGSRWSIFNDDISCLSNNNGSWP